MAETLAKALVRAQGLAKAVAKDATNTHMKYKYTSAEAMIEEARGALNDAGLSVVPISRVVDHRTDANGAPRGDWLCVTYRVLHDESGDHLDMTSEMAILPKGAIPQDKAEAATLTFNLGYFLRDLLLLPRGGDAVDERDDSKEDAKVAAFKARIGSATNVAELKAIGAEIMAAGLTAVLKAEFGAKFVELSKNPAA